MYHTFDSVKVPQRQPTFIARMSARRCTMENHVETVLRYAELAFDTAPTLREVAAVRPDSCLLQKQAGKRHVLPFSEIALKHLIGTMAYST